MPRKQKPTALDSLLEAFGSVPDPRIDRRKFHPLVNVLLSLTLFPRLTLTQFRDGLAVISRIAAVVSA